MLQRNYTFLSTDDCSVVKNLPTITMSFFKASKNQQLDVFLKQFVSVAVIRLVLCNLIYRHLTSSKYKTH